MEFGILIANRNRFCGIWQAVRNKRLTTWVGVRVCVCVYAACYVCVCVCCVFVCYFGMDNTAYTRFIPSVDWLSFRGLLHARCLRFCQAPPVYFAFFQSSTRHIFTTAPPPPFRQHPWPVCICACFCWPLAFRFVLIRYQVDFVNLKSRFSTPEKCCQHKIAQARQKNI